MSQNTGIEWTDATWNFVVGCTLISPGCALCYAKVLHDRRHIAWLSGRWPDAPQQYHFPFEKVQFIPERLNIPLHWRKPRRIFVNSVSDLFHEQLTRAQIKQGLDVMEKADWHQFQILTKRSERMMQEMQHWCAVPYKNIWLGVSVENRKHGLPRIEHLRQTPAAVRFLSIEPLLEDLGTIDLTDIHWVILGGESGAGARPMDPRWVRSIRDQCNAAGIPFFFKQWGEWKAWEFDLDWMPNDYELHHFGEGEDAVNVFRIGKSRAGRVLDNREWNEFPENHIEGGSLSRRAAAAGYESEARA